MFDMTFLSTILVHDCVNRIMSKPQKKFFDTQKTLTMASNEYLNDSDDDSGSNEDENGLNTLQTPVQVSSEVSKIFQQNITEIKNDMTVLQIRRTVRDKVFPFMKFTNEFILRQMKLRQNNNIVHMLLQDLNRLDDNDIKRAKFWLTYKNEVRTVLTTRKTEVSNQMKSSVVACEYKIMSPI